MTHSATRPSGGHSQSGPTSSAQAQPPPPEFTGPRPALRHRGAAMRLRHSRPIPTRRYVRMDPFIRPTSSVSTAACPARCRPSALPAHAASGDCTAGGRTTMWTCTFTVAEQTFTVPAGISAVDVTPIDATGAPGESLSCCRPVPHGERGAAANSLASRLLVAGGGRRGGARANVRPDARRGARSLVGGDRCGGEGGFQSKGVGRFRSTMGRAGGALRGHAVLARDAWTSSERNGR
jgi:hypothetical protein